MNLQSIQAKSAMLIRKPVHDVFEAFVNPAITSQFWFTKGSGRLDTHKHIQWDWEMYDFSTKVNVKAIEKDKRILVEWVMGDCVSTIEWIFKPMKTGTYVTIINSGFQGMEHEMYMQALNSTEGFTFVLAGAKAYLEHGIKMNFVADKFPEGLPK
jgi:uncharacterized protein YndB with AHSA1/START domain